MTRKLLGPLVMAGAITGVAALGSAGAGLSNLAALDNEYGFRGLSFGEEVSRVQGLRKVHERGACEVVYTRESDKLELEGIPLTSIEYSFQNDRFTLVSLLAREEDCSRLYTVLHRLFGDDETKLGEDGTRKPFWTATWTGKRVRVDITGPKGCIVTISAPEEAILEERRCREDDRVNAPKGE